MRNSEDLLGGRLPLLDENELDDRQRDVRRRLTEVQLPEAQRSGFRATTSDGRFIGPFNAYIRFPEAGGGLLDWAAAQVAMGTLSPAARQVVTLAVGAVWQAPFEVQAHVAGAIAAGVSRPAVEAVLARQDHADLDEEALLARRLADALLVEHVVGADLYDAAVEVLAEEGVAAVAHLVGQYVAVSALLIAFDIPAVVEDRDAPAA